MSGFLTKLIISAAKAGIQAEPSAETVCGCDFQTCFNEYVFADAAASGDYWKADKTSFIYKKTVAADTVAFQIWRNGRFLVNGSGTYGDFYASFTDDALLTGFVLDWTTLYNAFGGGRYQIKIQVTSLGNSYTFESRTFKLYPYSPKLAHGTVRIEGYQTGNVISESVDYSNVLADLPEGWYTSIRVPGRFGNKTPSLEVDEYLDSTYRVTQNRNQINNEYTLETKIVPASVSNLLTQQQILSNSLQITDYDLYSSEIYRRKEVVPVSIETNHFQEQSGANYVITFADRRQNIIKRNF